LQQGEGFALYREVRAVLFPLLHVQEGEAGEAVSSGHDDPLVENRPTAEVRVPFLH
jgi:hypothetical protein